MNLFVEEVTVSPSPAAVILQRHLQCNPYWSVRQLTCEVQPGRLIVHGTVPSYYLRQIAESLAAKVVGLEAVEFDIGVDAE